MKHFQLDIHLKDIMIYIKRQLRYISKGYLDIYQKKNIT